MPSLNAITAEKLVRLVGTPHCPVILDIRSDVPTDGQAVPGSIFRDVNALAEWVEGFAGREVIVICADGLTDSPGIAAFLRHHDSDARILEGGFEKWGKQGLPLIDLSKVVRSSVDSGSVWVTRARPKVDRIACPWLIRRFVDPQAVFLFVTPTDIPEVAERFGATPFDVDGAFWSHRGELCTFDVMVQEFGLGSLEALTRLALIVRGADTAKPEIAPQASGLLAASLGLSRMFSDDLRQLDAGMLLYDAFFRWSRDAVDETHDWVSHQPKRRKEKGGK